MYFQGILIGILSFVIIGVFHPAVIKAEFYLGKRSWWGFLFLGLTFCVLSLFVGQVFLSVVLSLIGFSCLWSILEVFDQEERVQKGWFPPNPKKKGKLIVRAETPKEYNSIRRINEQAFGQLDEAFLVEKLRSNPLFENAISLVAVKSNIVVGHALFFPQKIVSGEKEYDVLSLAPLAVFPQFHGQGIGSALVRRGLEMAKEKGHKIVVVLGDPAYYSRFGFTTASPFGISSPFPGPDECFMVLELKKGALAEANGEVVYPKEFNLFL